MVIVICVAVFVIVAVVVVVADDGVVVVVDIGKCNQYCDKPIWTSFNSLWC